MEGKEICQGNKRPCVPAGLQIPKGLVAAGLRFWVIDNSTLTEIQRQCSTLNPAMFNKHYSDYRLTGRTIPRNTL